MIESITAIDIETTGLNSSSDRIIEVGAVKMVRGIETCRFSELINPGIPIPGKITELTGIRDSMLQTARDSKAVLQDFYVFIGTDCLIGHNILFDYGFLKQYYANVHMEFERSGIDTLRLSKRFHPEFASRSLSAMCRSYEITNRNAHRAADDAQAAGELYVKLAERFYAENEFAFAPVALHCNTVKQSPATIKQKNYLRDLMKYHKIEAQPIPETKSEASRCIDRIILQYGRII